MSRWPRVARSAVATGTAIAVAGALHSWWNLRQLRVLPSRTRAGTPRVSLLVPARDEAGNIGHCLTSLRAQVDVPDLEIVVLDDRSSDGTTDVIAHHLVDHRIRQVVGSGEPPNGWLGKTWACHRLSVEASGSVLVFVDADVTLSDDAVSRMVALLESGVVEAVSPYPRQLALTWSERIIQPLLQWSWATLLPLGLAERSTRPSLVAANGQLLAITRDAYDAVGGHEAIRDEVLDDVALFQQLKQNGLRGALADGTEVATCRMYQNWSDLRDGYSKSLWSATGSPLGATAFVSVMALAYVVPPVAALLGSRVGAIGYVGAVGGRAWVAHRVDGRVWPDSVLHPASVIGFGYLTARSWVGHRRGSLTWKSRPLP
ncbi:MAG: glycosyltransferase family 2 protein [Actinomycetia bacterium]|nr:glycosyltransferase family 2 protein [Actinomycetes bacterium]